MSAKCLVCKTCCFCIPLRYGCLAWGYFILLLSCLVFAASCYIVGQEVIIGHIPQEGNTNTTLGNYLPYQHILSRGPAKCNCDWMTLLLFPVVLIVTNIALTIIFIIGCHKKNVKLLKIYYIYCIFILALLIFAFIYLLMSSICKVEVEPGMDFANTLTAYILSFIDPIVCFACGVLVGVVILLVRSEITKLDTIRCYGVVRKNPRPHQPITVDCWT